MTRQKPKQQQQKLSDAEIIAIIAGALATNATAQSMAATLSPLTYLPHGPLLAALIIATSRPVRYQVATIPSATASAESAKMEAAFRAHYVLNAARRLANGGDPTAEQRFFNQHLEAVTKRRGAASAVDKARARYGNTLGWQAVMDNRTSPECKAANGKNFDAGRIPAIGYPGAVHPFCRCKPVKKYATSQTVYSITPERKSA